MALLPRSLLTAAVVASAPSAAVLAGLVVLGDTAVPGAIVGALAAFALSALVLARPLARLEDMRERIERLVEQPPEAGAPSEPIDESGPIGDVAAALFRLERNWQRDRKALRDNLRAAQILFDALPDPLVTIDGQARLVYANAAARALLEGRHGLRDLTGRDLSALMRQPAVLEAVSEVLLGVVTRTVEFTFTDRVDQTYEARIEPIRAEGTGDDDARALLLLRDVTALRRGEQMRADFVANVSHEMRTPLTSLVGFIETLRGPARGDKEAQARFLDLMESQANRMTRLVKDLLSLSRIEMNEHTVPKGRVDLRKLLGTVVDLLGPQARKREKKIVLDLAALDRPVVGDHDELVQLFQNLIENAVKYSHPGTSVRIEAESAGDMVTVSVVDRGDGISREHIPRLTERFYRVDTARSRELGGTGLGLAIVKHIINRHRGELSIHSVEGEGSTFSVTLRLTAPEVAETAAFEASKPDGTRRARG